MTGYLKRCHNCKWFKWSLPLFLFKKSNLKYQLKSDLGRCRTCKVCNTINSLKGPVSRKIDGKFTNVKLTKLQVFVELFK